MSNEDQIEPTLKNVIERLELNQSTLEDIATWLKISGVEKVRILLEKVLDKPEKTLVYHYSTEERTTREIKDLAGAGLFSISSYQTSWFRLGLMKKIPIHGKERYVKNFNLDDFGIQIPEIAKQDATTGNQITEQPKTEDQPNDT